MAKDNSLFDTINCINNKTKLPENTKIPNNYILSLWMAQDRELIEYVSRLNPYIFDLPKEMAYKYFLKCVPKKKRFIRWTGKEKIDKKTEEKISQLCQEYGISPKEAKLSIDE